MNELPQDHVPTTLDEAVAAIIGAMEEADRAVIRAIPAEQFTVGAHFGFGMYIRNEFSLWEDTPLTRWFRTNLRLGHSDDLSGVILDAVACDVKGVPRNTAALVKRAHDHWAGYGCNEFGEPAS